MELQAAQLIRTQWVAIKAAYPEATDRQISERLCFRLFAQEGIELDEDEVREALRLTSLASLEEPPVSPSP